MDRDSSPQYTFCFGFAKEPGFGVRTLTADVAKQMWQLTLAERFAHMDSWNAFLDAQVLLSAGSSFFLSARRRRRSALSFARA